MQKSLVKITTKEEKEKKALQKSLQKKQVILSEWMEKVEMLRMSLDLIKNEYDVRIGALLLKDNQLDLEIIRYKNLKKRIDEGMSYEEAMKAEEDTFYNEILRIQKEQEKIRDEEKILESRREVTEEVAENIKLLWKKLIRRFHPDLTLDQEEKTHRESVMKQINTAYAENNLERLQELEQLQDGQEAKDLTIERLKEVLVHIENMIISWQDTFKELRMSEWYAWKARKEKAEDVFADLERSLLDDIVNKIGTLKELKVEVEPHPVIS